MSDAACRAISEALIECGILDRGLTDREYIAIHLALFRAKKHIYDIPESREISRDAAHDAYQASDERVRVRVEKLA